MAYERFKIVGECREFRDNVKYFHSEAHSLYSPTCEGSTRLHALCVHRSRKIWIHLDNEMDVLCF